ncbi:hypothetical protein GCM10017600_73480 [Streptosporangium carneum]|uniref:Laminin G domain-containing protein n=2 Tax=Streptosporangium carneum TaxID=47481 RepID=A0A9W6I8A1_9ACTN|nr:hypothetical protein GCM10017600_73480 [Streptosporangium carneum]
MLPGLLPITALPAEAVRVTASARPPDTPEQLSRSAARLPSLVSEKTTTTSVKVPASAKKFSWPKGALPIEARSLAAEDYCARYPYYDSTKLYPAGSVITFGGHIWRARKETIGQLPGGGWASYWVDEGVCPPPPSPPKAPSVSAMFPTDQMLVDSRTPLLVASGWSNQMSGYSVRLTFKVCDDAAMSGAGCFSSEELLGSVNSWRIPDARKLSWSKQYWWKVTGRDTGNGLTDTDFGSFTTGVRQPAITSQLATRGVNGQEFHQLAGNYTTTSTDASVAAAGPPLSIVRSYNSMDPRTDGLFGAGWSTRFDMKIRKEKAGEVPTLLVTYPDGRQVRFADNGDGTFQPPPGMYATLAEVMDTPPCASGVACSPVGWRLMDKSSTTYLFDDQGQLSKVTDAYNRSVQLERTTDGKLSKVTAPGGRFLAFTWNGNHVASVSTPPVDGQPPTWTYAYQGDQLTRVCTPMAAPHCTDIDYTTGSLYRSSVLDSDALGYWRLNETSGTTAANSGWGTGTATYGGVSLAQPGALAGTGDTAATFSGTAQLTLPSDSLARLQGAASFETWFKTASPGTVLSVGTGTGAGLLYVGTDGKLRGQLRRLNGNTPIAPITSAAAVNDSAWHHVVLAATGTEQQMYLDGQLAGVLPGSTVSDWPTSATVGAGSVSGTWPSTPASGGFPFTGQIDEIALYAKALTPEGVQVHYAARAAVPYKLTKITQPSGRIWAANAYDAATDRIRSHTDQHGGTWQLAAPAYDANTGLSTVTVTDPKNNTLKYAHDAWRGYRMVSQEDQLGKITSYTYDTGGFLAKTTDPNDNTTQQVSDARGNVTAVTICRAAGNCQTSYRSYYRNSADEFDPRNDQVTATRDARSTGATDTTYATVSEYTAHGELAKQTTPATPDFPSGRSDIYAYTDGTEAAVGGGTTPAGLLKSAKDAKNNETTYRYTAAGDLAEQTSPSGLITAFTYDAVGRVASRKEMPQAHSGGVTTTFTYDGAGRVLTQTAPGVKNEVTDVTHTAKVTFTYDADGNKLTETLSDLTGGDPARTTTYAYDTHGRLETVTDPENGVTRAAWDNIGARVSTTDPMGTVTTFDYTKRGELATTTLKNWTGSPISPQAPQDKVLESNAYDPGGRLASRVDAMGRKTTYTYFADNRLSQMIADDVRLNGSTTPTDVVLKANTYDAAGNITRQVTGGDKTKVEFVYDAAGRMSSTTLEPTTLNRKTAFTYDAVGNITRETFTGADTTRTEVTDYVYNALNQVTRQTVENGADDLVTTWTYDDRGLLTATTDPRGNASGATAADFTTTTRYDLVGRPVESKAPQAVIEKNGAAAVNGRPTTKYGYNTADLPTHTVDAEGRTVTAAFDKAGRLTSLTSPSYTPSGGTALTPAVGFAYDAAGRTTQTTDPRGYVTTTQYDALGRPVKVTDPGPSGPGGVWVSEYDLLGEKLALVDPTGARAEATYDDLGRKITETQIERKPATVALTTTLTYDTAGNLTKSVAPGNKTTTYTVNASGQITSVKDPLDHASTFDYDLLGRTTKVTDPLGNATEASYDLAGRRITAKDLDNTGATVRTFGFGYDAAGNPTSTTSGEGHVTRREFDALDRMTSLIEPVTASKSITTTFGYDATGARTRLTDGRGNSTWTTYNSLGLPEAITEPATTAHPAASDRTWTALYDIAGNPAATLQPGGVRIDRTFDHLGRLTKETGAGASVTTPDRTYAYDLASRRTAIGDYTLEYNDRGLLTKVSKATNQVAAYAYDALGNPTQRVDATGTANFTYDNASRLATAGDPVTGRSWTYGYDNADRLTSQTSTGTVNSQSYTYDAVDRPLSQTLKNSSGSELAKVVYGWDKDDNLTTKTTTGTAGAGTNTYSYDRSGRLTSWTAPGGATTDYEWDDAGNRTKAGSKTFTYDERNRLTSGDGVDYTYTPRGTLATETKAGVTRNLAFDAFDRLVSDGDATYGYDALGRLTSRTKGADQQRFVYSGLTNDIAVVTDGTGAIQAKYGRTVSGGLLSLQEGGTAALGVMSDLHGDVVGTFSGTALVDSAAYDPFGTVTQRTGAQRSLGYQGEYTDPDTGKVNMHARWYQPGTGAFTSRDDWTLNPSPSVQANRYTYANANLLVGTDPSGHILPLLAIPAWQLGVLVVGAVGAYAGAQYAKTHPFYTSSSSSSTTTSTSSSSTAKGTTATKPQGSASTTSYTATRPQGSASTGSYTTPTPQGPAVTNVPQRPAKCVTSCGGAIPKAQPVPKPKPVPADLSKVPDAVVDTNSPSFINDPHNANNPIYQRTAQQEVDYLCTHGACTRSYTGHEGVQINTSVGEIAVRAVPVTTTTRSTVTSHTTTTTTDKNPSGEPEPRAPLPPVGTEREEECQPGVTIKPPDSMNRPVGGNATYCNGKGLDGGTPATVDPVYWPDENPEHPTKDIRLYDRCHLIGRQLGGSGQDVNNLTPCITDVNNGPMKRIENHVVKAVRTGLRIDYEVTARYEGNNTMPDRFRLVGKVNGEIYMDECLHNDLDATVTDGIYC